MNISVVNSGNYEYRQHEARFLRIIPNKQLQTFLSVTFHGLSSVLKVVPSNGLATGSKTKKKMYGKVGIEN